MGFNQERRIITCCKDCPDRYPGCHGSCEKYKEQRAKYDAEKAEVMKRFNVACGLYEQKSKSVYKITARQRYRSKYR
jgi:hypothetical protein